MMATSFGKYGVEGRSPQYEAVGELDPRQETLAVREEPNRKGVIYYLDAERHPRSVLVWGIFGRANAARDRV